ncbi:MAG: DUF4292 domain-containing protein [Calditrichaeota bacterium]|nr:MAG: DUF4292 domain-containing protein [Calditrichota bacterium]
MMHIRFFLLLLLFTASCTALKKEVKPAKADIGFRDLLENQERWQQSIRTFSARVRLTLDSPEYSGTFDAEVLRNGPDSLLITVRGPFGMPLGKVFVNKHRFIFYNQIMNQFISGERHTFSNRRFLQFPVSMDQLIDILTARNRFSVLSQKEFSIRDNHYFLRADNGNRRLRIWFDTDHLLTTRLESYEYPDTSLRYYITYENFQRIHGIYFPQLVNFVRPAEKQGLSLIYTEIKINEPVDGGAFLIEIDADATQIDLTM